MPGIPTLIPEKLIGTLFEARAHDPRETNFGGHNLPNWAKFLKYKMFSLSSDFRLNRLMFVLLLMNLKPPSSL